MSVVGLPVDIWRRQCACNRTKLPTYFGQLILWPAAGKSLQMHNSPILLLPLLTPGVPVVMSATIAGPGSPQSPAGCAECCDQAMGAGEEVHNTYLAQIWWRQFSVSAEQVQFRLTSWDFESPKEKNVALKKQFEMQVFFPTGFLVPYSKGSAELRHSMSTRQQPRPDPQLCSSLGNLLLFKACVPQTKLPVPDNALDHSGCKKKPSEHVLVQGNVRHSTRMLNQ